jgi:hypothetical protein
MRSKDIVQDQIRKRSERRGEVDPHTQVKIVRYGTTRKYAQAAPRMAAAGWIPSGQSQARSKLFRLSGRGIIVTWTKPAD